MTRYCFDDIDGTVDEIDTDEELRREEERGECLADEYRAQREFAMPDGDDRETEYWNDLERRRYELADKLLARAYGED